MGQKLPPEQLKLYKGVDEILWKDWDPIGISNRVGGRDEYNAYLPHVFKLMLDNEPAIKIAAYLDEVARNRMALNLPMERHVKAAEKIYALRQHLNPHPAAT
jgi:hypothetical protein